MRRPKLNRLVNSMLNAVALGLRRFRIDGRAILASEVYAESVTWQAPPVSTTVSLLNEVGSFFGAKGVFSPVEEKTAIQAYKLTMLDAGRFYQSWRVAGAFGLGSEGPLIFSNPEHTATPGEIAACFAMEFVQFMAMSNNCPINLGPQDCWTVIGTEEFGIKDGKVLGSKHEAPDLEMLMMLPRGMTWETYTLNVFDRIALWVDMNGGSLPPELAGLRDVVTLLRFTTTADERSWLEDTLARGLLKSDTLPPKATEHQVRVSRTANGPKIRGTHRDKVEAAIAEFEKEGVPDPVKVFQIMNLLVPHVISQSNFNSMFVNMHQRKVSVLAPRSVERIRASLQKLLEAYDK